MRISYSQVAEYLECPQKYKLGYVDERRKEVERKPAQAFGTVLHSVLSVFHSPGNLFCPGLEELLEEFRRAWGAVQVEDEREREALYREGRDILQRYYETNWYARNKTARVEEWFSLPLGEHSLTGRIDRVDVLEDGTFEVLDYKTSRNMPGQPVVDADLQLSVYHLAAWELWKPKEIILSLYYLYHNHKMSTRRTKEAVEGTKGEILRVISGIEKEEFEPVFGAHCDWCDYDRWCPMTRHKYKEELKVPEEPLEYDIEAVAREYVELIGREKLERRRLEELKGILHAYFDSVGIESYYLEGAVIWRGKRREEEFDLSKLKAFLEPLGLFEGVVKLEVGKLRKLVEEGKLPKEVLEEARSGVKESYQINVKLRREAGGVEVP